jgi:predicted nucleic acid-binding protein
VKVLIDTNVVLDVLLAREPFVASAAGVLARVDRGELAGCVCATTLTAVFYLAAKTTGRERARVLVRELIQLLDVAPVNRATIEAALQRGGPDFEDDVIVEAALAMGVDVLVTRDPGGFRGAPCRVMAPDELLAAMREE